MPLTYTRTITDEELALLHHHVLDATEWIDGAINGKIAACRKRIVLAEIAKSVDENKPLPASTDEIVANFFKAPDYKGRKQRDLEETDAFQKEVLRRLNKDGQPA